MGVVETWYVMEDGSVADPREVAPGDKGILAHKDGRAVAYSEYGPRSRSVDVDEARKKAGADKKVAAEMAGEADKMIEADRKVLAGKEVSPEATPKGYKTRESKSR